MNKTKEALWKDYNDVNEKLTVIGKDDADYEMLLRERDNIRNEMIKLDQVEMETNVKKCQIDAENKREKIRNRITIGTFVVTTGISVYTIIRTFKFDEDSTVTSTLGRGILNGVIPKMFKR